MEWIPIKKKSKNKTRPARFDVKSNKLYFVYFQKIFSYLFKLSYSCIGGIDSATIEVFKTNRCASFLCVWEFVCVCVCFFLCLVSAPDYWEARFYVNFCLVLVDLCIIKLCINFLFRWHSKYLIHGSHIDRFGFFLLALSMALAGISVFFFWMVKTESQMLVMSCVFSGLSIAGWNSLDAVAVENYPTNLR